MNTDVSKTKTERTLWQRGMYMVLFAFLQGVAKFVVFVVAVFQFLTILFTGSTNEQLLVLGRSLSIYNYQIFLFLTFNTEQRPYPFSPWPRELVQQ